MAQAQIDPLQRRLNAAPLSPSQRAIVWQAFEDAPDEDVLASRMDALGLPQDVKRDLWEMKHAAARIETVPAPSGPQGSATSRFLSNAGELLNPITMVEGLATAVRHPIDTGKAIVSQQVGEAVKAADLARQGRYSEAVGHGAAAFLPVIGPIAAAAGEQIGAGDVAGGLGKAAGLLAPMGAARLAKRLPAAARTAAPISREAELARFGLEHGVPVDVATATANPIVRAAQKIASHTSLAGSYVGTKAAQARAAGITTLGEELAAKAATLPATRETAGTAVRAGVESSIRGFDDAASTAYGKLREMERAATPQELVTKTETIPTDPALLDRRFILRWLADDLKEMPFQPSTRMRGVAAQDVIEEATSQEAGLRATYAPRVAGSPVQDTLNLAGVSGTKAELAARIETALQTGKIPPKLSAVADAYAQAWDGQGFDFDLVSDDALVRAGLMRKALRSPVTMPDVTEPGASRYFPESSVPEAPKAVSSKTIQAPVDLRPVRESLAPLLERLTRKKDLVGVLQGSEARAVTALDRLVHGEDFASLSDVDAALGDVKAMARGAAMPELRSAGQGTAAFAVKTLDKAVMGAASNLGPEAVRALREGRIATVKKYAAAEVLKVLHDEPVKTANAATAPQDAAVMHLRDVQKYAPDALPQVGRAVLSEMLQEATKEGGFTSTQALATKWAKLGPQTKQLLFRDADYIKDLDAFWSLAKKAGENPNPSGSAYVGGLLAHGYFLREPLSGAIYEIGMGALAKALNSPKVTRALLDGMRVPVRSGARAAAAFSRLGALVPALTKASADPAAAPQGSR